MQNQCSTTIQAERLILYLVPFTQVKFNDIIFISGIQISTTCGSTLDVDIPIKTDGSKIKNVRLKSIGI